MMSLLFRRNLWVCVLFLASSQMNAIRFAMGDKFDDIITKKVKALNIRGAAIAYFDKNTMLKPIARGYGKIASSDSSPLVDADTTFMLASVSKTFTASAVAVLLDQGKITLDDDICNVKPADWDQSACRNPAFPNDKVTWRMLITHRSSLQEDTPTARDSKGVEVTPSYGPNGGYVWPKAAGNPTCPLEDVQGFYRDILTDKPTETSIGNMTVKGGGQLNWYELALNTYDSGSMWQNYRPGSKNTYSNFGAGYVPALVQLLTGQDFPSFTKQYIFDKLGMTKTAWFSRDLPKGTQEVVPVEFVRKSKKWKDIGDYCYIDYGSGQLRTTANDLTKWGNAMLQYGAPMLWSKSVGAQVVSCQERQPNGGKVNGCEFGMGWAILDNSFKGEGDWTAAFEKYDWTDGITHNGYEAGVQTNAIVLPKAGVYVFVLTNTDMNSDTSSEQLTREVQKAAYLL